MALYSDFAYSSNMQYFLFLLTCTSIIVRINLIVDIVSYVNGYKIKRHRIILFSCIIGLICHTFVIYGVYFLCGSINFSHTTYSLLLIPNPVFIVVYYFSCVKILEFSKSLSIYIMRMIYIYIVVLMLFGQLIQSLFFSQISEKYNFLLDAFSVTTETIIYIIIYILIKRKLKKEQFQIKINDCRKIDNVKTQIFYSFLQISCIYYLLVKSIIVVKPYILSIIPLIVILTMYIIFSTTKNYNQFANQELENKDTNILILSDAIDDFSGLKHDFYNILQTYEGYISMGDLQKLRKYHATLLAKADFIEKKFDLAAQMAENPKLTAIIVKYMQKSASMGSILTVNILCNIGHNYIANNDLCLIVEQLLESAIDDTYYGDFQNTVMSIAKKEDSSMLIIVNNISTQNSDSDSPLEDFEYQNADKQFLNIRNILRKYKNVLFHVFRKGSDFSAYVEISPLK